MSNHWDSAPTSEIERLEELFFAALDQPPERRDRYLDERCGSDAGLRAAVESLLRADRGSGGVVDDEAWRAQRLAERLRLSPSDDPLTAPGVVIGGYRLVERIGSGGMGAVWRAHRADETFERTVAIKLIRSGMDTEEVLRRFRRERQVLARLEHPHIARLYDGGATTDGRPYLVMEYVQGVPIDRYCDAQKLELEQSLRLACAVCDAVQFAHAHLVLHGDIKPANVLVAAGPTIKLLDFGIAKLLTDDGAAVTVTLERAACTPRYASPEQVRGERLTTASDVYSLGVLLYEMLTGQSPYGPDSRTWQEVERAVHSDTPPAPSVALARCDAAGRAHRGEWARRLRGDLDRIVGRALAKAPQERYASAEQLGEDIRRHLDGLPLLSRGPSTVGRLVRAMRRHRRGVLTASVTAIVGLATGVTAVSYWFMTPSWASDQVRAARRAFLSPDLANTIWVLTFNTGERLLTRERPPACPLDLAAAAIAAYDAALGFDPGLDDVRIERDTVWLSAALSRSDGAVPAMPGSLLRSAPLACAYATAWARDGTVPELTEAELATASATDLRSLGLLAVLCGEPRDCMRAWSRLGEYRADPLVESLLGILYLANEEPQRAYPRLLSAYREHSELGFLCTYLADAAIAVGDVSLGRRLLERAATLSHLDPLEAHRRVRLRYCLATGQEEAAEEVFAEDARHDNPVLRKQYAQYLFEAGRARRAISLLVEVIGQYPAHRTVSAPIMRGAVEFTQRWWGGMNESQRQATIMAALDESPDHSESLYRILDCYRASVDGITRFHTPQSLALDPQPPATDPLLESSVHGELQSLIDRLDLDRAHRWARFHRYSPELRTLQLEAWSGADARERSLAVDEAYSAWERGQPAQKPEHFKLTPATPGERSFGRLVGMQGETALVLSTKLASYDRSTDGWERREVATAAGARLVHAALDASRVLALIEESANDEAARRRVVLFARDIVGADWREAAEIRTPGDADELNEVGLRGNVAYVAAGSGETPRTVYLFREHAGSWFEEHAVDAGQGDFDPRAALGRDTLVLLSAYGGSIASEWDNTLSVLRREPSGSWRREMELQPPASFGAGAVWDAVACDGNGDALVATVVSLQGHRTAVRVLRREKSGLWRDEADLAELVAAERRAWLGRKLAMHGDRVVLAECDFRANARAFHVVERSAAGWRYRGVIGPFDSAYSDDVGEPALSDEWMIFGAPRHDAVAINGGAAYLVNMQQVGSD